MGSNRLGMASLALIVVLGLGATLRAADDKKVEGDLKKLQGKWSTKSGDGENSTYYTFDGSKLEVKAPNRTYEIKVTLDEQAKPEKTIDLNIVEAPEDAKGKLSKGIYKFDGDKFIFCFRAMGERPTKFETIGFEQIVVELTKPKDKK